MNEEQIYLNFDEYKKVSEPHKRERAEAWRVAIGLQAVDGLQVSEYLKQTARRHIEGEITIDEACQQINQYYISKTVHDDDDENKAEADKVSTNIAKLIGSPSFTFNPAGVMSIHRSIFEGVFKHAGKLRTTLPRKNGCNQDYSFLNNFFRNLLMGENNELKNRYMLVNPPEEWQNKTSTGQAQDK